MTPGRAIVRTFPLGEVVATRGALASIEAAGQSPLEFLSRHLLNDWGELSPGDRALNDEAVGSGDRIHSAYRTALGTRLWIITDPGHLTTTILLPDEY